MDRDFNEERFIKLWQLTGYVYQGDEIEFQKMEERKKAKRKAES